MLDCSSSGLVWWSGAVIVTVSKSDKPHQSKSNEGTSHYYIPDKLWYGKRFKSPYKLSIEAIYLTSASLMGGNYEIDYYYQVIRATIIILRVCLRAFGTIIAYKFVEQLLLRREVLKMTLYHIKLKGSLIDIDSHYHQCLVQVPLKPQ